MTILEEMNITLPTQLAGLWSARSKRILPVFPAELATYIPSAVSDISYLLALNDLDQLSEALAGTWDFSLTESALV